MIEDNVPSVPLLHDTAALLQQLTPGLYVVATPIGNIYDITFRACAVLRNAQRIACEDTRVTHKLLTHLGLWAGQKLIALHDHNERAMTSTILDAIQNGAKVALVSDAGTPLLSDPGFGLVREAIRRGVAVHPIPGPSAMLAALVVGGLPTHNFYFGGFMPQKSAQRRQVITDLATRPFTHVFYEAPHRLVQTLRDLDAVLPDRTMAVARELTKKFEECVRGTPREIMDHFQDASRVRGECVIVIGPETREFTVTHDEVATLLRDALRAHSMKSAVQQVSAITGMPRKSVYALALGLRATDDGQSDPDG